MKFILDSEHLRYFRENHKIEFEDLISSVRLDEVNKEIDRVLTSRTGAKRIHYKTFPAAEVFPYGRDLWQESDLIKKFNCQNRFAELILSLFNSQKFILGYDQLIIPEEKRAPYYESVFPKPVSLNDISSVQGIHGALIVCLEGTAEAPVDLFPGSPGSIVALGPEAEIDFSQLKENTSQRFLLIAYAKPDAVYQYQEKDPNTHYWKNLGYVFGDKLLQKGHPYIRL